MSDDPIERMVAEAKARAVAARAAEAARERAERERRVEVDRHLAESLLTRVRPPLEELARALSRQLEGDWQVEWHAPQNGGFGLRLDADGHPAQLRVTLDRNGRVLLERRCDEYNEQASASMALDRLETELAAALQVWVEELMASPYTRFRA